LILFKRCWINFLFLLDFDQRLSVFPFTILLDLISFAEDADSVLLIVLPITIVG